MRFLGNTGIHMFVLLVCQAAWQPLAYSQSSASPKITEQIYQQDAIYHTHGDDTPQGYVIDRALLSYATTLPPEFDRALANLGPSDRWLDIGAGQGRAILDYYGERFDSMHPEGRERRGSKASSIAMSIEDRRTPLWEKTAASLEPNKVRYLHGKRLREYSVQDLGRFQLITDMIGGFSYAVDLSLFMEKVLGFLEVGGSFFSVLQDVHSDDGSNLPHYANSAYLTEIENNDGAEVRVCTWLKSITCVEVTCQLRPTWTPPIEVYGVRKVCNDVRVPALATVHYEAGTPPERRYMIGNRPVVPASRRLDARQEAAKQ